MFHWPVNNPTGGMLNVSLASQQPNWWDVQCFTGRSTIQQREGEGIDRRVRGIERGVTFHGWSTTDRREARREREEPIGGEGREGRAGRRRGRGGGADRREARGGRE